MAKLKKHKLLEKAMRDYPAGTRFKSAFSVDEFTSKAQFMFVPYLNMGEINISDNANGCIYINGKWAEIVPAEKPSILTGKVAIQVNNEREFKLLMRHYAEKGWRSISGGRPNEAGHINASWSYGDEFGHAGYDYRLSNGYTIIPFNQFAAETGITVPAFVMLSEDGVPLYEGDNCWVPQVDFKDTLKGNSLEMEVRPNWNNRMKSKFFSTKEAAQAWIDEQNKPTHVQVSLFGNNAKATVEKDCITIGSGGVGIQLKPSDLEDMLHALRELQGSEVK